MSRGRSARSSAESPRRPTRSRRAATRFEASYAAGALLLPHEERSGRLLISAAVAHGTISLFWGLVLVRMLPRQHPVLGGTVAGLAIAAFDLGTAGRRVERIRRLPLGPQLADHAAFGAAVGAVIARSERRTTAQSPRHG